VTIRQAHEAASAVPPAECATPIGGDVDNSLAAVSEVTAMLGSTRWCILASGGLLAAGAVGFSIVVATWPVARGEGGGGLCCLGLLAVVMLSWLRAATLLALAERPVASALGELRRRTGAPVDPSVPWVPFGVRRTLLTDLGWEHAWALVAAATLRHTRALSDWRSRHMISAHQRHITLLDQAALRRIAGPPPDSGTKAVPQ
jgi:hypothetical protein